MDNWQQLENISKEAKENVIGVSRFLVLIMDKVLVTWNNILTEYLPEREKVEEEFWVKWKSLLNCFLDLLLENTDALLDVLMHFFPRVEIVFNLRHWKQLETMEMHFL